MSRLARMAAVLLLILLACSGVVFSADVPSDDSVVEAWERVQRADPQTIALERIEPRLYRFETRRFPYDGRLRIVNVSLDGYGWSADGSSTMAVVEVELVDATDDFYARHAHSVPMWQATNILYFDDETGEWLDNRAWQQRLMKSYSPGGLVSILFSNWFWIALLGVMVVVLIFVSRKANRGMDAAMNAHEQALSEQQRALLIMEEGLKLSREANRSLTEILETLRRPGR